MSFLESVVDVIRETNAIGCAAGTGGWKTYQYQPSLPVLRKRCGFMATFQSCELAMTKHQATKEKVREYMERRQVERRQTERTPPHDPEQIRKEVGWDYVERRKQERRNS